MIGALLAALTATATATATAKTPAEQQAAAVATATVSKASGACSATIDSSRTRVQATDPLRATIVRPAGFDVTISGSEGSKYSARNDFSSQWLVADGQAYPQNIAAARLATGCGGEPPSNPKTPLDWHRLTHLDSYTGDIQIGRPGFQGAVLNPALRRQIGDAGPLVESQAPVWAPKCKAGGQFVEFVRYVELLGPPASLRAYVGWASAGLRRDPIDGIGVYINGTQVATLFKRGILDVDFDERTRNLIQFGRNRISIVAHKEKTGSCNKKGGKRQVGITFLIKGKQAWQTTATRPPPAGKADCKTLGG